MTAKIVKIIDICIISKNSKLLNEHALRNLNKVL